MRLNKYVGEEIQYFDLILIFQSIIHDFHVLIDRSRSFKQDDYDNKLQNIDRKEASISKRHE